jgi:hypothetical protein
MEILPSDLLLGWNDFGQYCRCCVKLCDWIFQAMYLLRPCVKLGYVICVGYKTFGTLTLAVAVLKKESIT